MLDPETFETRLTSAVHRYTADDPRRVDAIALARTIASDARARRSTGILAGLGLRPLPHVAKVLLAAAMLALLAAGAAFVGSRLLAPSPSVLVGPDLGTFSLTGPMAVERYWPTATQLLDGTVLVVGSQYDENGRESLAETWDPGTNQFDPAGTLLQARNAHSATRLPDGRVLIVGGLASHDEMLLTTAEIWDPQSRTFSPTGSLSRGRANHSASLQLDGRVLVTGGILPDGTTIDSSEIWDPASGSFSPADPVSIPAGARLLDGRVLVVEGQSVLIWDPHTQSLSPGGTLVHDHSFRGDTASSFTATTLRDGRVLIAGGSACIPYPEGTLTASLKTALGGCTGEPVAIAEIWDPTTLTSSPTAPLQQPRRRHAATLLADGRVILVGNSQYGSTAEVFELK